MANKELAFTRPAHLAHLGRLPRWSFVQHCSQEKLIPSRSPVSGWTSAFLAASMFWPAFQMAAFGAALVLVLQEIAEPSPLFLTVPWQALEFVLSHRVRANHFWLHRTQEFLQESAVRFAKVDGFATREGFILIGASLDETQIQSASRSAWRTMSEVSPRNRSRNWLQDDAVSSCSVANHWGANRAESLEES